MGVRSGLAAWVWQQLGYVLKDDHGRSQEVGNQLVWRAPGRTQSFRIEITSTPADKWCGSRSSLRHPLGKDGKILGERRRAEAHSAARV